MINCITRANRSNVQSNSTSIVFLGIDLFEDQSTIIQPKRLNICLAIDCSGSMQGAKFEQAKQSASILARSLAPNDLISIVTFEARVRVELSPTPASELEKIEKVIQSIRLGSATFLYSALKQAHKVVSKNSKSSTSRIVLLTDGIPTDNENTQDYIDRCNEIRKEGITVSPIGLGDQYNENLLLAIGDSGGGEWKHVTNPQIDLPDFLRQQLSDMANTVMVSPQLIFETIPGAEIMDIYSVKPHLTRMELPQRENNRYSFLIRDIIKGQDQTIALRLKIPSQPSGEYNLLSTTIANTTTNLSVTYTDDPTLYSVETDPNPRIQLLSVNAETQIGKIVDGDEAAREQVTKILTNIASETQTKIISGETRVILDKVQSDLEKTRLIGNASEMEKKEIKEGTTKIIR